MTTTLDWLEKTHGGVALKEPNKLTWDRGPVNPDTHCPHAYVVSGFNLGNNPEAPALAGNELTLYFQNGVVPEVGLNGLTPSILLEILIDRFEHFQKGPFACEENEQALVGMRQALTAIEKRLVDRQQRGVLNTLQK